MDNTTTAWLGPKVMFDGDLGHVSWGSVFLVVHVALIKESSKSCAS